MKKLKILILSGIFIGLPLKINAENESVDSHPCTCAEVFACQNDICRKYFNVDCAGIPKEKQVEAIFECYKVRMKNCTNWYSFLRDNCGEDVKKIFY